MGIIKSRLIEALEALAGNGVIKTPRGDNAGKLFGRIFFWQETIKYAEAQLDGAWKQVTTVNKPREAFDKDEFIATVAKEYEIDLGALNAIALGCVKKSKAPLSKRVLELDR